MASYSYALHLNTLRIYKEHVTEAQLYNNTHLTEENVFTFHSKYKRNAMHTWFSMVWFKHTLFVHLNNYINEAWMQH